MYILVKKFSLRHNNVVYAAGSVVELPDDVAQKLHDDAPEEFEIIAEPEAETTAPEDVAMIYNGISPEKTTVNEKAEMCTDKINLLFVGRFDPQKGVDFLLKVFDEHVDELKHIHLWVVGDSVVSDGEGIEKKKLDNITFLGWIPHDKLPAYYEACDAVIMPSRWEAFGLVAIEAMKYGKPIIASKRGALPELVKDDVNGWTFEMDNEYALLGILSGLDKLSVNIAGRNGERIFLDRFTDVRMLEKFNDILGGVFVDRKENTGRTASWHR